MKLKIFDGRARFRQWDVNQRLICEGVTPGTQIHFSSDGEKALVVESYELDGRTIANVPNILLQNTAPIHVYVYLHETDERYTKYEIVYTVLARPKPDDYIYEETEILSIESVVNNALQKAKESGEFKGDPGPQGEKGETGEQGKDGLNGKDGYTPQKGVDYFTEADKQEIVQETINKLPIDNALSATSTNPVQNKVVTQAINSAQADANDAKEISLENQAQIISLGNRIQDKQDKLEFAEAIDNEANADKIPTAGVVTDALLSFLGIIATTYATKEELNNAIQQAILDSWEVGV